MAALCWQLLSKLREQAPPWSGRGAIPAWVAHWKASVSLSLFVCLVCLSKAWSRYEGVPCLVHVCWGGTLCDGDVPH